MLSPDMVTLRKKSHILKKINKEALVFYNGFLQLEKSLHFFLHLQKNNTTIGKREETEYLKNKTQRANVIKPCQECWHSVHLFPLKPLFLGCSGLRTQHTFESHDKACN